MAIKKKFVKCDLGDLVQVGGTWKMVGIVNADEKTGWWLIKGHVDINSCVVDRKDIVRVIKKQAVPRRYVKMMRAHWQKNGKEDRSGKRKG